MENRTAVDETGQYIKLTNCAKQPSGTRIDTQDTVSHVTLVFDVATRHGDWPFNSWSADWRAGKLSGTVRLARFTCFMHQTLSGGDNLQIIYYSTHFKYTA